MQLKYLTILFAVVALSLATVACSGDDDGGDGGNGDQPTATTEATGTGDGNGNGDGNGGGGGDGTATLTIGEESWSFDGVFCAFSPEEAQSERISFTLTSFGESSTGARTQLDASIYDPQAEGRYEGADVIRDVSLDDVEDFENPSVSWSSISGILAGGAETDFQVDGDNVSVDAAFDDGTTDDIETVPGTLTATCP